MDYDFTSREREFGCVVFALTLDKKRMSERIVIGRSNDARRRLDGDVDCEVYFDKTCPLGNLLLNFEADKNGEWNKNGMILRESYSKIFPSESGRWKTASPVSDFLRGKYEKGEPSAMFAAIRTWEDYLNCFNMNHAADVLTDKLSMLYKSSNIYGDFRPWKAEAASALTHAMRDGESSVELWYPIAKHQLETVVAFSSFLPVVFYYLNKVKEWGYVFQQCKICDAHFLARSRHYELCSDKCRRKQAATAKKEFDERAKGDKLEQLHESAYYYWYNRWRKLKKGKSANLENAAAFKVELDKFCKEAIKRKTAVKNNELPLAEFSGWLAEQQNLADKLIESYTP